MVRRTTEEIILSKFDQGKLKRSDIEKLFKKMKPVSPVKPKPKSPTKKRSPIKTCTPQTTKKYIKRPSPPYPANACHEEIMMGNDGRMYKSTRIGKQKFHTWKPI